MDQPSDNPRVTIWERDEHAPFLGDEVPAPQYSDARRTCETLLVEAERVLGDQVQVTCSITPRETDDYSYCFTVDWLYGESEPSPEHADALLQSALRERSHEIVEAFRQEGPPGRRVAIEVVDLTRQVDYDAYERAHREREEEIEHEL